MLEIVSCQRHSLYLTKQCSFYIFILATLQKYLKCFFQIVFSVMIIISVQFTPYHPHENRTSSDLANVETKLPCILFCRQKLNTQNCFSVNRCTVLWKNGISSHVKCVMYVLTKKIGPVILVALVAHHTPILISYHGTSCVSHSTSSKQIPVILIVYTLIRNLATLLKQKKCGVCFFLLN